MYQDRSLYTVPDMEEALRMTQGGRPLLLTIETTGLSYTSAFVFMFTAVYPEGPHWHRVTMLADHRRDERALLTALHEMLTNADVLYSFGHHAFSGRFLSERWENVVGEKAEFFPPGLEIIDMQHRLRKIRHLLMLDHLSRSDIEDLAGFKRKVRISGRKIAGSFSEYEKTRDMEIAGMLIRHQEEDIESLFRIGIMNAYCLFTEGDLTVTHHEIFNALDPYLKIEAVCGRDFPADLSASNEWCGITLSGSHITMCIPLFYGRLKYFLPGPAKDYYYLPEEDCAIHKSVAMFVDKAHRRKATQDTCYTTREGCFLAVPEADISPIFLKNRNERPAYIQYDEAQWQEDPALPHRIACMMARSFEN